MALVPVIFRSPKDLTLPAGVTGGDNPPLTGDGNQTPRRNTQRDEGGRRSTMQDVIVIAAALNNN